MTLASPRRATRPPPHPHSRSYGPAVWGTQDAPLGTVALLDAPKDATPDVYHFWIVLANDARCVVEEEQPEAEAEEEEVPDCSLAPPGVPTYYFSPRAPPTAGCWPRVYTCFGEAFLGFQNAAPGTTGACEAAVGGGAAGGGRRVVAARKLRVRPAPRAHRAPPCRPPHPPPPTHAPAGYIPPGRDVWWLVYPSDERCAEAPPAPLLPAVLPSPGAVPE